MLLILVLFYEMFLMILFSLIGLGLLFVFFFPQFYICELIISFLPFIVFFSLFVAGIFMLLFFKTKGKIRKICAVLTLLFCVNFFCYAIKFNSFYTGEGFQQSNISDKSGKINGLDILYSNIFYKIKNYTGLVTWIEKYNPDVVLLVEFTEDFNDVISVQLNEKYPYSARVEYSDKYYGNVVFSKYPIKNLTQEIERGRWRYSYFSVDYSDTDYYIYLVHTAAPVSLKHFRMRNNQLQELVGDFSGKDYGDEDKILVIGDFNLSPWSFYYKQLERALNGLYDLTKNYTILFTWAYRNLPVITSHIDHVFVNEGSLVDYMQKISTPGSDHYGFFIKNLR